VCRGKYDLHFLFFGGKIYFYSFLNVVPCQKTDPQYTADVLLLAAALNEANI